MPTIHYFAYGSNLLTRRLRGRVPSARPLGPALLKGHSLAWQKIGADGSGKCDIAPDPDGTVWGVLYELDPVEKPHLDAAEGLGAGYEAKTVAVWRDALAVQATTYQATHINPDLQPWHWYKDLVLAGSREHELPSHYMRSIEEVRSIEDPNVVRRHRNEAILNQKG